MAEYQVRLEAALMTFPAVAEFMRTAWAWPVAESVHFVGLTLLLGSIGAWDLRLLGFIRDVPAALFHRLIPYAVLGFSINAVTGSLFLMTEPNQYLYNRAFQFKFLCLALAGLNVVAFYLLFFRRVKTLGPDAPLPVGARLSGGISLLLWISVITCGRLITFYRPFECQPGEVVGFVAACIVR